MPIYNINYLLSHITMPISMLILDKNNSNIQPKMITQGGSVSTHFAYCVQETIALLNKDKVNTQDSIKEALFFFFMEMGAEKMPAEFKEIKNCMTTLSTHQNSKLTALKELESIATNLDIVSSKSKSAVFIIGCLIHILAFSGKKKDFPTSFLSEFKTFISALTPKIEGVKKIILSGDFEKYIEEKHNDNKVTQKKLFFDETFDISKDVLLLLQKYQYKKPANKIELKKSLEKLLRNLTNSGFDEDLGSLLKHKHLFDINGQDDNENSKKTALHYAIKHPTCYTLLIQAGAKKDIPDANGLKVETISKNFSLSFERVHLT